MGREARVQRLDGASRPCGEEQRRAGFEPVDAGVDGDLGRVERLVEIGEIERNLDDRGGQLPQIHAARQDISFWPQSRHSGWIRSANHGAHPLLPRRRAVVVCLAMAHNRAWARPRQVIVALSLASVLVSACPNRAAPQVFFLVHGSALDGLARQLVAARRDLRTEAQWLFNLDPEPPSNVTPRDAAALRERLRSMHVLSVAVKDGEVVFPVDGFWDNARGFVYFAAGARLPAPGEPFHYGTLAQLVPLSRPGWYFFTTTNLFDPARGRRFFLWRFPQPP